MKFKFKYKHLQVLGDNVTNQPNPPVVMCHQLRYFTSHVGSSNLPGSVDMLELQLVPHDYRVKLMVWMSQTHDWRLEMGLSAASSSSLILFEICGSEGMPYIPQSTVATSVLPSGIHFHTRSSPTWTPWRSTYGASLEKVLWMSDVDRRVGARDLPTSLSTKCRRIS